MDFNEIREACFKFESKLIAFIQEYLDKYPTYSIIRERGDNGELLCIDYRTLEISVRNESELEKDPYELSYWRRFKFIYAYEFIHCTKDDSSGGNKRTVSYQDAYDIACGAVESYIRYNKIEDYWSLPAYLLPTPEELAEKQEQERRKKEEQKRLRKEEERIKAEHAFRKDAVPAMLIIPDIHGRTFWKKAVECYSSVPVIFLGDYLDPYCNDIEQIEADDAWMNFNEIIEYKHTHKDQVTLLLGNHDLHYLCDDINCSRKDTMRKSEIEQVFKDNIQDFVIAICKQVSDRAFLFSHAGIVPGWLDLHYPDIDKANPEGICNALNSSLRNDSSFIRTLIVEASCYRGGPSKFGSPVWADIVEHEENEAYSTMKKSYPYMLPGNVMQIFGHTQQKEDPVYRPHFCCLDCRRPFLLTTEGIIMEAYL